MAHSKRSPKQNSTRTYQTNENEQPLRQEDYASPGKPRKTAGSAANGDEVLGACKLSPAVMALIASVFSGANDLTKDIIESPAVRLLEEVTEEEAKNAIREFADRYRVAKHKILRSKAGYFRGVCQKYWKQNREQKKQELLRKASNAPSSNQTYSRQLSPLVSETIESLFTAASGLSASIIDDSVQRRLTQLPDSQAIEALHEFCNAVMYRQDRIRNMNAYLMNIIKRKVSGSSHARQQSTPRSGYDSAGSDHSNRMFPAKPPHQQPGIPPESPAHQNQVQRMRHSPGQGGPPPFDSIPNGNGFQGRPQPVASPPPPMRFSLSAGANGAMLRGGHHSRSPSVEDKFHPTLPEMPRVHSAGLQQRFHPFNFHSKEGMHPAFSPDFVEEEEPPRFDRLVHSEPRLGGRDRAREPVFSRGFHSVNHHGPLPRHANTPPANIPIAQDAGEGDDDHFVYLEEPNSDGSYTDDDQRQHADQPRNQPPPHVPTLSASRDRKSNGPSLTQSLDNTRESRHLDIPQQLAEMKQQNMKLHKTNENVLRENKRLREEVRSLKEHIQDMMNRGFQTPYHHSDTQSHGSVESFRPFVTPPPMGNSTMPMFNPQIPQSPQVTGMAMPNGFPPTPQGGPYMDPFYPGGPFPQQGGFPQPGFQQGPFPPMPFPQVGSGGPPQPMPQFVPINYTAFTHSQPNQYMNMNGSQPNSVPSFPSPFGPGQFQMLPSQV